MVSQKVLVITGQTGTGKTSVSLQLARELGGELISADSRQIYQELTIGTGKADSEDELSNMNGTWHLQGIPIHGINLVSVSQQFSAGEFSAYATETIKAMHSRNKLPIIVGGTGFYIKSVLQPDETISVPPNELLRHDWIEQEKLDKTKLNKILQSQSQELDPTKLNSMNESDINNPRRLMRAVEVGLWKKERSLDSKNQTNYDATIVVLYAAKEYLEQKVSGRVEQMFNCGYEEEVRHLNKQHNWDSPGMQTIGYREWKEYFEKQISREQLKQNIIAAHLQYARKQLIYMRRFKNSEWFNIQESDWKEKCVKYCKSALENLP